MPRQYACYPTPASSRVTLTPDGAPASLGQPYTAPDGRTGQVCYVGDDVTSGHGAGLLVEANGHVPFNTRGFLVFDGDTARLQVDDMTLTETPATPPPPDGGGGNTPETPQEIIQAVYEATRPNLATLEGCGQFTEDCVTALHTKHSQAWGHIDKDPGQNQYNGHAVDACQVLLTTPECQAGIYDIIFSSASPEAKPAFNFVGPPAFEDWVYPAGASARGAATSPALKFERRIHRP